MSGEPLDLDKSVGTKDVVVEDDSDDEFIYPGAADTDNSPEVDSQLLTGSAEVVNEHTLPEALDQVATESQPSAQPSAPFSVVQPSPAQLEALYAAASSGDLRQLQNVFKKAHDTAQIEPFALANDASPRTGLTTLHAAASRGYLDIVTWLVEECGAMPDLEDKEGETALHKASINGHLHIVRYLLPEHADVHARDADGWTALHNACSKGYLDIVRWLCEHGGAIKEVHGAPGIDIKSKGGWTPLMNASSKGHLPIVLYLLSKQNADPLVRNNWGETAYDAAAAVFEVWICESLQKAEAERWRLTTVPYDPLPVHITVPLILYENQRLDTRLKTLAVNSGKAKFSASGLGRSGRRAPFELKLPRPNEETGKKEVAAWRSDVQLPLLEDPWVLPTPGMKDGPREGAERSHFWLSDWTLDVTHPGVDAGEGWQYARSFQDPEDQWAPEPPPQLARLLTGNGAMSVGLGSPVARGGRAGSSSSSTINAQTWVRRRRWIRVMRRRLDIPPLPYMQPDGAFYHFGTDGTLIPHHQERSDGEGGDDGQELGSIRPTRLGSAQDYVARARYLAGTPHPDADTNGKTPSAADVRRVIAKLERATSELRQGVLTDEDGDRRIQGEVLLNAYSRELERRRLAAGAQGLLISGDNEDEQADDNDVEADDSDEEFHYPGASPAETIRPVSIYSQTADYFTRPTSSRAPTDLTPHLSQAPEFRVPTHEAPQKVLTPRWTAPTPHQVHAQWERDEHVSACRECNRRFNFLTRRHCRRCGRIFCDRCSSYRALLDPSDVVSDPTFPETAASTSTHRVCRGCHEQVTARVPSPVRGGRTTSMERIVVDQGRLSVPHSRNQSSSQISDLAECPVCGHDLLELGTADEQEMHVRNCLEGGTGASNQASRYLVYKLPAESVLVGTECVICLEEFTKDSLIARLSCLCSFHNACLSSWLQRGRNCPVHAR